MHDPDHLFRKSVTGVIPLRNQDSRGIPNKPRSTSTTPDVDPIAGPGKVDLDGDLFYRSGVQKRKLRELRRGRLKIADILDLHGYTQVSTPAAITNFLASYSNSDNQCVMIITGKGRNSPDRVSVVRATALETLRKHPRVLAYCCSQPVDGGHGAFYILLRR
jgi:DNA-nicking Smr family endonuclease